jgi:hypothetical protein
MAIQTSTNLAPKNEQGFFLAEGKHIKDVIIIVEDNTARDALPSPVKTEGLIIFSVASNAFYQYLSSAWVEKSLGATPDNGLKTLTNGNIGLGGTLTEAFTVIDGDGNSLFVTNFGGLNFFSQGFLSQLSLSGGTTQLIGQNTTIRGGSLNLTSEILIGSSGLAITAKDFSVFSVADILLSPGAGDGRGAKYAVVPTILDDETIPSWENVKELDFTFLAFTVDSSSNDSAHVTFRGQIEIDDTSETKDDYISSVKWQIRSVATSNVFIFPPAGDTLSDLATYIDTNIGSTDKFSVRPVPIYTGSGLGSVGFDYKILYR